MAFSAAKAMRNRTMPPWPMISDGSCGNYLNSPWLSELDIKTVENWLAAGTPEGTPRSDLITSPKAALIGGTPFKTPNFTPVPQGGSLAAHDEYRCFVLPTNFSHDQFVTGYEVSPGNKAMIHHVLVYSVDPSAQSDTSLTNGALMKKLDNESPDREGWPCFGSAGDGVAPKGVPVSWAPGQGATYFPENTGFRIRTSDQLIAQVHYNLVNPLLIGQSDQTQVSLALKDSVAREGFFILNDPFLGSLYNEVPDTLAPGRSSVDYTWSLPMAEFTTASVTGKLDLYGSMPHMHERGNKFSAQLVHANGTSECAADIQEWDFHWQHYYFYSKPFTVRASDVIKATCTFDTSADTVPVLPGWGTDNEMCLYGMFLVPQ